MSIIEDQVLAELPATADTVRHRLGLPREWVYTILVHLEAIGKARVVVSHPHHRSPPVATWESLT